MIKSLGLCYVAKKCLLGDSILDKLKSGQVQLILVSKAASQNTKKRYHDKSDFYHIELIELQNDDIALSIGKPSVKVIGITDSGFCKLIKEEIKNGELQLQKQ